MSETTLELHMAVVGRVTAKFVSTGLMAHNIDTRAIERFLGVAEASVRTSATLDVG